MLGSRLTCMHSWDDDDCPIAYPFAAAGNIHGDITRARDLGKQQANKGRFGARSLTDRTSGEEDLSAYKEHLLFAQLF